MPRLASLLDLIREYGRHIGTERRCSCCDKYTLYALHYPDGTAALVCSRCDVES